MTWRAIDHLVLIVDSLKTARARYEALGFSVRRDGLHPFGTANCCIVFGNGTFLEPLAIADRAQAEAAIEQNNPLVGRQDAFRFRHGEGLAMLAMASEDAEADRAAFSGKGYGRGPALAFERPARSANGGETIVGFKLAFAVDHRAPDATIFTCQHRDREAFQSAGSQDHENGALGVTGVYMAEINPADFQYYLEVTTGQRAIRATSLGIEAETPNGVVAILTPGGMKALFGLEIDAAPRGLRLWAVTIGVKSLDNLARRLDDAGIVHRRRAGRLIVDAAPGQGAAIAFEETAK